MRGHIYRTRVELSNSHNFLSCLRLPLCWFWLKINPFHEHLNGAFRKIIWADHCLDSKQTSTSSSLRLRNPLVRVAFCNAFCSGKIQLWPWHSNVCLRINQYLAKVLKRDRLSFNFDNVTQDYALIDTTNTRADQLASSLVMLSSERVFIQFHPCLLSRVRCRREADDTIAARAVSHRS